MSRIDGLLHVLRQQPYEAALALALAVSAVASLSTGAPPGAAARVLPVWALRPAAALLALSGALTVGGLFGAGYVLSDVRRVLARRVEQSGQTLMGGVLLAVALGAFSAGRVGIVPGTIYAALAAASSGRAALIGHTFRAAGRERTDLI